MSFNGAPGSSFAVIFGALLFLLSLTTLWNYFFTGDPVQRNLAAQIEAKRDAANLLRDYGRYRRRRLVGWVFVLATASLICVVLAPTASAIVAQGILTMAQAVIGVARAGISEFWQQLSG